MAKKAKKTKSEKKQDRKNKRKILAGKTVKGKNSGKTIDKKEAAEKAKARMKHLSTNRTRKDIRYIVRIANRDLNGETPTQLALTKIKGISHRYAEAVAKVFEKETGFSSKEEIGKLKEEMDAQLEDIIINPVKHGIPEWMVNRKNDRETGESKHLVSGELLFSKREDLKRLNEIKSYRGLRHSWGLTVRGQRTKSTHRGKGGTVGVTKKDAKK